MLATFDGISREISELESHVGMKNAEFVNESCQKGYIEAKIASLSRAVEGKKSAGKTEDSDTLLLREMREIVKNIS